MAAFRVDFVAPPFVTMPSRDSNFSSGGDALSANFVSISIRRFLSRARGGSASRRPTNQFYPRDSRIPPCSRFRASRSRRLPW